MFATPFSFSLLAKKATRIKYLSRKETERFFSCIEDPRDKAIFGTIYFYGLRVSEATLLTLEDIDLERKRILIYRVKGGIGGERPLFKTVEVLLRNYLKARISKGEGLFTGVKGTLTKQRIQQLFKYYIQEAGLNFSVHSLRHSIAVHLLEADEGIEFVRDHLGHKKIENTLIYAQISDKRRKRIFTRVERKIAKI